MMTISEIKQELKKYAKFLHSDKYLQPKMNDYLFKSNKGSYLSKQQIIAVRP